jgi:hypothetical protein
MNYHVVEVADATGWHLPTTPLLKHAALQSAEAG